jgi:CHAT domain-containing protein
LQETLNSALILANKVPLTVSRILSELDLTAARLITLSACETGITDIHESPDEYLGMTAAFLQAGAPAVVSTLWAVDDVSTMLLMERFYQLHLEEKQDLPEALR